MNVVPFFRCVRGSDWNQEELAQLYRIENGLRQARVVLETDRGITDEGDPWFVFCRGDGEVLVHITRLDNEYYLHSPVLPKALVGKSFPSLTKSFMNQIPLWLPMPAAREAQLFVHPAAMMAVIIGTIFFVAQDARFSSSQDDDAPSAPEANEADAFGDRDGLKEGPIESLNSLREWGVAQKLAYLNLLTAVTAVVLGTAVAVQVQAEIVSALEQPQTTEAAVEDIPLAASLSGDPDDDVASVPRGWLETAQTAPGNLLTDEMGAAPNPGPSVPAIEAINVALRNFGGNAPTTQGDDVFASKSVGEVDDVFASKPVGEDDRANGSMVLHAVQELRLSSAGPIRDAQEEGPAGLTKNAASPNASDDGDQISLSDSISATAASQSKSTSAGLLADSAYPGATSVGSTGTSDLSLESSSTSDSSGGAVPEHVQVAVLEVPSEVAVPADVSEVAVPADVSEVAVPADASEVAVPADVSEVAVPADASEVAVPADASEVAVPADASEVAVPADVSEVAVPANASEVAVPADVSEVAVPADASEVAVPADASKWPCRRMPPKWPCRRMPPKWPCRRMPPKWPCRRMPPKLQYWTKAAC